MEGFHFRKNKKTIFMCATYCFFMCFLFIALNLLLLKEGNFERNKKESLVVNLAIVNCGYKTEHRNRLSTLLKSIVVFAKSDIHAFIFTESEHTNSLTKFLDNELQLIELVYKNTLTITIVDARYPERIDSEFWSNFDTQGKNGKRFNCVSLRLFLPIILPKIDSIIYMDTDVVFLADVTRLWNQFGQFNDQQILGAGKDSEHPIRNYNTDFRNITFMGTGINSGILLMNLTRMRQDRFIDRLIPLVRKYKLVVDFLFPDQDLLNCYIVENPSRLFRLPCNFNFLCSFCNGGDLCVDASLDGVSVLHGFADTYQFEPCSVMFKAFRQVSFSTFSKAQLKTTLETGLTNFFFPKNKNEEWTQFRQYTCEFLIPNILINFKQIGFE